MGVLREGGGWCFCSGGGKSERVKGSIFSTKGTALAAIAATTGGGVLGTGFLIHRSLLLTTHANLPSATAAEAAEICLHHGRLSARLVPHRFFITSSVLDLTIVGLDTMDADSASQGQQPQYLKTCCNPSLDLGNLVYLLGHTDTKELTVGEGKVVIATDNLIKLSTDGVKWSPGSAGFDVQGNLAFMVCDPMKLASSPAAKSSSASSSSSHSWKRDFSMQFGIPIPIICDWLHQHWEGSLDDVSNPKLHSCASFTLRQVFKPTEGGNEEICSSSMIVSGFRHQLGSGRSGNADSSQEENRPADLREQGIPTPQIYESPRLTSGPVSKKEHTMIQLLDINFPPRAPRSIALPLPLRQLLPTPDRNPSREEVDDGVLSEVQSSSSPMEASRFQNEGGELSSGEETMYSAETMESHSYPSPRENKFQQVGRSQSCVGYSRWGPAQRNPVAAARKGGFQKQHSLVPVRKSSSHAIVLPQRSHDYLSPTVSSSMKKRIGSEQPARTHKNVGQVSSKRV